MDAWRIITPRITAGSFTRSPDLLAIIVRQFDVETNPRYAVRGSATYCNIFVWDCTKALGCEIPHYWYGHELSANGIAEWLHSVGAEHGWARLADESRARHGANLGLPVVAVWSNQHGSGHVAIVLPTADCERGVRIAQAGARCFCDRPIAEGFGSRVVEFWSHN